MLSKRRISLESLLLFGNDYKKERGWGMGRFSLICGYEAWVCDLAGVEFFVCMY